MHAVSATICFNDRVGVFVRRDTLLEPAQQPAARLRTGKVGAGSHVDCREVCNRTAAESNTFLRSGQSTGAVDFGFDLRADRTG